VAFRYLAAGAGPDYRSISRFRRRHLDALAELLAQSLHLAQRLGMVKMGRVALDGTKLEASASRHKAMSYPRLVAKEEQIEAEIAGLEAAAAGLLADAERTRVPEQPPESGAMPNEGIQGDEWDAYLPAMWIPSPSRCHHIEPLAGPR
jgi:hypothetical protein